MEVGVDIIVETHIEIDFKTEADSEANLHVLKEETENLAESQSEADANKETQNQEISETNPSFPSTSHLQDDLPFRNNIPQLELVIKPETAETLAENQHVSLAEILPDSELKTDVETASEEIEVASLVNTFTESEITEIEAEVEEPESILPFSPPPPSPSSSPSPSQSPPPSPEVIDIGSSSSDEERGEQQQQFTPKILSVVSKSETFTCDICSKNFANRNNLLRHKRAVHILKPFSCHFQNCFLTFSSKSRLEGHLSNYRHKKSTTTGTTSDGVSASMTGSRLYWCIKCLGSFASKESLDAHKLNMHREVKSGIIMKAPEKSYVCVTCNKLYRNRKALSSHVWGVHGKKREPAGLNPNPPNLQATTKSPSKISSKPPVSFSVVFECRAVDCPATFPSPTELELHERKHETSKGFEWKCSQCTVICPSKYSLNEHYLIHTGTGTGTGTGTITGIGNGSAGKKLHETGKIVTYVKENLISSLPVKGEVIYIDLDINEDIMCNDNSDNIKIDNPEPPPEDERVDPLGFLDMDLDCHEQEVVEEQKQELLYSLNIPQEPESEPKPEPQCQVFDQQEEIKIDEKPLKNFLISESDDTTSFQGSNLILSDSVKVTGLGLSSTNNDTNCLPISFLLPSTKSYPNSNAPAPM